MKKILVVILGLVWGFNCYAGTATRHTTYATNGEVNSVNLNGNFDNVYNVVNGNIENVNIKSNAAIVDTKLAQITTAGKVSGAALTLLTSVPSAAGLLPAANGGTGYTTLAAAMDASGLAPTDTAGFGGLVLSGGSSQIFFDATNVIIYHSLSSGDGGGLNIAGSNVASKGGNLFLGGGTRGDALKDCVVVSRGTTETARFTGDGGFNVGLGSANDANYAFQMPNAAGAKAKAYAWDTYSDSRIKKNQIKLKYGLKEILHLLPKEYEQCDSIVENVAGKKSHKIKVVGNHDIGLIAQELNKVIPEAVSVPSDEASELWAINYTKLIPVLINAIQEQQDQIEDLKTQISRLSK